MASEAMVEPQFRYIDRYNGGRTCWGWDAYLRDLYTTYAKFCRVYSFIGSKADDAAMGYRRAE